MTTPQWALLAFALWTLLLLAGTVGVYRWRKILSGQARANEFPADHPHGEDWYRRAMRAHANCVENLPVFAALVLLLYVRGLDTALLDNLALAVVTGRVMQSLVHVALTETPAAVMVRFVFFFIQIAAMAWIGVEIITA